MNKILDYYLDKWWRSVLLWAIVCVLLIATAVSELDYLFLFLTVAILFILLISALFKFFRRKWLAGLFDLFLLCFTVFGIIAGVYILILTTDSQPYDNYADNLKMPTGIVLEKPLDRTEVSGAPDSITAGKAKQKDFQLYNSFQPGLYRYEFRTKRIEKGTIYLKAYEITKDDELSSGRLYDQSAVAVENHSDTLQRYGKDFTIYEGDWGQPYAARFEVWFEPAKGSIFDKKILEKNYVIEGWMR